MGCRFDARLRKALLAVLAGFLLHAGRPASAAEQRCYRQQTGGQTDYFSWEYLPASGYLVTRDQQQTFQLWADRNLATRRWQLQDQQAQTRLEVERRGEELVWHGTRNGEPVRRRERIDPAPWFQALSLSLQTLLTSHSEFLDFWMIRPDTLELYKLRASRKGWSQLDWAGGSEEALQIRVTVPGIPAMVWHSDYWLGHDGRFLRFAGKTSLVGAGRTEVELLPHADLPTCGELLAGPASDLADGS